MKKSLRIILTILIFLSLATTVFPQPGRWAEPVNISNNEFGSHDPDMAIGPDGKIHVVWDDFSRLCSMDFKDILYAVYDGEAWSEPVQLSAYEITYSKNPRIAIDSNGYPHVVWFQNYIFYNPDVYYTTLTDSGWLEPVNLTTETYSSLDPDIVIDSNDYIHLVWEDYCFGNWEIVHSYYNGEEWSDLVNVSNEFYISAFSRIEIDSQDRLHVLWNKLEDGFSNAEVYYSKYENNSWLPYTNISQNPTWQSIHPYIAIDPFDNPHIVWKQKVASQTYEIFYSFYNGINWSESENITNLNIHSDYPSLSITSQGIKCLLFMALLDDGLHDPFVNYSFGRDNIWLYPDSVFDNYVGGHSTIAIDNNDVIHACVSTGFTFYYDIAYTYYYQPNSVSIRKSLIPEFYLLKYYPNPFNSNIRISFNLIENSEVNLGIYNINGQLVKMLENKILPPGEYINYWNGTNRGGKEVSGGVYFIRLQVNDESTTKKIIYLK